MPHPTDVTRVIVIRHGFSVNNALRRNTGQADVPLSVLGYEQAERLADYLVANEQIDAIYASDLCRAVDTIQPTADRLGLPVMTDPALRETDVGEWTGLVYEESATRYPEIYARRKTDPTCPYPGGESNAEVFARVSAFLAKALEKHKGECFVITTHSFPVRVIDAIAKGRTVYEIPRSVVPNASIRIYTYQNGTLSPEGEAIVSHLEPPVVTLPSELV